MSTVGRELPGLAKHGEFSPLHRVAGLPLRAKACAIADAAMALFFGLSEN